jgi:hypothetical protein
MTRRTSLERRCKEKYSGKKIAVPRVPELLRERCDNQLFVSKIKFKKINLFI